MNAVIARTRALLRDQRRTLPPCQVRRARRSRDWVVWPPLPTPRHATHSPVPSLSTPHDDISLEDTLKPRLVFSGGTAETAHLLIARLCGALHQNMSHSFGGDPIVLGFVLTSHPTRRNSPHGAILRSPFGRAARFFAGPSVVPVRLRRRREVMVDEKAQVQRDDHQVMKQPKHWFLGTRQISRKALRRGVRSCRAAEAATQVLFFSRTTQGPHTCRCDTYLSVKWRFTRHRCGAASTRELRWLIFSHFAASDLALSDTIL